MLFHKNRLWVTCMLLFSLFAGFLAACSTPQPDRAEQPTIRIGLIAPLSGDYAETTGRSTLEGAKLAVQHVNARGGIAVGGQNYTVTLLVEDDANTPQGGVAAARKLIAQERVVAIVGVPFSSVAIPVAAVAETEHIPLISTTSTNPETTSGKRYVFRTTFTDLFQGKVIAHFVFEELNMRKASVLYDIANAYNRDIAIIFKETFEQSGGTVVAFESYTTDEQDWEEQLLTIRKSEAEILFLPNYSEEIILQAQQAHKLGITTPFIGGDTWDSLTHDELLHLDGSFFTTHWFEQDDTEQAQTFIAAYEEAYSELPGDDAVLTYDALGLLFHAIEHQQSIDPESIRDGIATMTNYTGITGKFVYHDTGDPDKRLSIVQIQDGGTLLYKQIDPTVIRHE